MGKEAKIGMAAIVILVVVLGVVLFDRIQGWAEDRAAPDAQAAVDKDPSLAPEDPLAAVQEPMIVPAKAGSDDLGGKPSESNSDLWHVVGDDLEPEEEESQTPLAPPTFVQMPELAPEPSSPDYGQPPLGLPIEQAGQAEVAGYQDPAEPPDRTPGSFLSNIVTNSVRHTDPRQSSAPYQPTAMQNPLRGQGSTPGQYNDSGGYGYRAANRYPNQSYDNGPPGYGASPAGPAPQASYGTSESTFQMNNPGVVQDPDRSPAEDGAYRVGPNDNYWTISEKLYGTGGYFRALAEHNRKQHPDENRLGVGDEISAPAISELEEAYRDLCPRASRRGVAERRTSLVSTSGGFGLGGAKAYVVQEGDTLFDIARHELGKAARWVEICEMNRDTLGEDYDYLTPGMRLFLPQDGSSGTITSRPGNLFQR